MTKEDFKARVSMAYEGREQWETFLNRVWSIHTSELPRWISVADELPKTETEVLMVSSGSTDTLCGYRCKVGKNRWYCYNDDNYWHNITHWMPMPQPPIVSKMENTDKKGGEQ